MFTHHSSRIGLFVLSICIFVLPVIILFVNKQQTKQYAAGTGTIYWSADFETGNLSQIGGIHVGNTGGYNWGNSSATVVTQGDTIAGLNNDGPWIAPAPRSGKYAVGLLIDGPVDNVSPQGSQRAELTSGYYDKVNTERWYGLSVYIPSNPNKDSNGNALTSSNLIWETGWGTSLFFKLSSYNDNTGDNTAFQMVNAANSQNGWSGAWYHIAPIVFDKWIDFTIHVYWANDATGYFEVYENGQLVSMKGLSDPSFNGTRATGPNYGVASQMVSEYDFYREPKTYPNLIYFDELKIGDTYDVVQPSSPLTGSVSPTPAPSGSLTASPVPTINPSSAVGTAVSLSLCPHGIGHCGDNANPQSKGNTSPQTTSRQVTLSVFDINNTPVVSGQGTVTFDASSGTFKGSVPLAISSSGQYVLKITMPRFLTRQIGSSVIQLTAGQTNTVPQVALIAGDINGDNKLDILDYNILISCYGSKATTSSCINKQAADITDDGIVDGFDYNLFLRELSVQTGQ